jgi:antitoxin (DNA-binding transcriptional repressor) of toxin-antitoxin stability system
VTTGGYLSPVKSVGIKVLKAKLSEYLRLAKGGETILVTERDEVVAEIRPARRQPSGQTDLDESLAALAEKGEVTLASEPVKGWGGLKTRLKIKGYPSDRLLSELREESR